MAGESRFKTFLTSGPGLITAAATFIAAVTGLITAITQLGDGDSASPAAKQAGPTQATVTEALDPSERELRSRIPEAIRASCGRPIDPEPEAIAAVNCRYRAVVGLQYNLFASATELEAGYEDVKRRYGLTGTLGGGSCAAGPFEGEYRAGNRVAGRLLCFVSEDDGVAAIVWTDRLLDIMSFAWRDDGELEALFDAWAEGVGPER
jgi:hypothetical protein